MKPNEQRFTLLQQRWQAASAALDTLRGELNRRYQAYNYAPKGQRDKLDTLDRREGRASDAFLAYLAAISPRDWTQGIPVVWLRDGLIYADAVTAGQLSVVPPAAWGYTAEDSRRFAWPATATGKPVAAGF